MATVVAAAAAVATWALARAAGNDLLIDGREGAAAAVPIGAVVLATVVGAIAAAGIGGLARRTTRPRRTVAGIGAVGLVVSAVPPVQAARDTGTALWLLAMHAVVAAVLLPVVWKGLPAVRPVADHVRA